MDIPQRTRLRRGIGTPQPISNRRTRSSGSAVYNSLYPADGLISPEKALQRDSKEQQQFQQSKAKAERSLAKRGPSAENGGKPSDTSLANADTGASSSKMSGRPRNRGLTGRDGGQDGDHSADILNNIIEGLRQAKKHSDESKRIGDEILALEQEIADSEHKTPDQLSRLDDLYRAKLREAEAEKKVVDERDIINSLAILKTLQAPDDPAPRNGAPKSRKGGQRPIVESDVIESPGPSPNEARNEMMKRVKGTGQRSSSVASQSRATVKEDPSDVSRGVQAERAGLLVVGADVFYKFPKGSKDVEGEGIHGIIKKVWLEKKPCQYDIQDPEADQSGKPIVRKAVARELVPIPTSTANLSVFATGSRVYAKYPDTDTFYNAEVRNFAKGVYTLIFEGEEDDRELFVDKRFVLDAKFK